MCNNEKKLASNVLQLCFDFNKLCKNDEQSFKDFFEYQALQKNQNRQSFVEKETKTQRRQQVEYIVNMTMEQQ